MDDWNWNNFSDDNYDSRWGEPIHRWTCLHSPCDVPGALRSKHTMVTHKEFIYVFGGDDGNRMLNDLLRYDPAKSRWDPLVTTGQPLPRYHHSAVVHCGSMYVFGGYTGDIYSNSNLTNKNDLHQYRFDTHQWTPIRVEGELPKPRSAHGAVVYDDRLWIFAGYDGNARLDDMWNIKLNTNGLPHRWEPVKQTGDVPPSCCNFPVVVARDTMFVFSGQSGARITNTLFQFSLQQCRWSRVPVSSCPPPSKRYGHTMVAYEGRLYVFGGGADTALSNELHCFDLDTQTWSVVTPAVGSVGPSGRLFHTAVVLGDVMYVYGGIYSGKYCEGVYRFQFSSHPKCTLVEDLGKLLKSEQAADVEIVAEGGVRLAAHSCILATRSTGLHRMLREASTSAINLGRKELLLQSTCPAACRLLLNYIYTDQMRSGDLPGFVEGLPLIELLMDVCRLAAELEMSRLQLLSFHYLRECIKSLSLPDTLHSLSRASSLGLDGLKECCLKRIVREDNFIKSIVLKEFELLPKNLIIEIIRRHKVPPEPMPMLPSPVELPPPGHETLARDMRQLLIDGFYTDVVLRAGSIAVKAHKAILISRSSYFEAMFRSFDPAEREVIVAIGETIPTPGAFRSLIKYIYCGLSNMPPDESLYLLEAANFFGFSNLRLQTICQHNLEKNIDRTNVLQVLEAADTIHATEMKQRALSIIVRNLDALGNKECLQNLSKNLLVDVIAAISQELNHSGRSSSRSNYPQF